MRITVEVPENEASFFKELLRRFDFVKVVEEESASKTQAKFVEEVQEALQEVELHQAGKKPLKTAKQMLGKL